MPAALLPALLASGALQPPPVRRAAPDLPAAPSRRALLALLPAALLTRPDATLAAATGGGFEKDQFVSRGGGPPAIASLPKLTKGEPSDEELKRLVLGYKRLQYLLANWEAETTICIRGCKGKYENCGCTRDPVVVQGYMGYKSMNDPLFKVNRIIDMLSKMLLVCSARSYPLRTGGRLDAPGLLAYRIGRRVREVQCRDGEVE